MRKSKTSISGIKSVPDPELARWLVIYADNEYWAYEAIQSYEDSLLKKYNRGTFILSKAWRGYMPILDRLAREKKKDYGEIFNKATRELAAQKMVDRFLEDHQLT